LEEMQQENENINNEAIKYKKQVKKLIKEYGKLEDESK